MNFIVIKSHTANYPNPIRFQVGDSIQVGKRDDEFPGWIWVTTGDGNQGWAPIQYLQIDNFDKSAIAQQDYTARELNTTIGENLILKYELNGWGWVENEHEETGWVPLKTIQALDEMDE
jgi:hypothetical protein